MQPDLILLDQHLPPFDGIEAGRVILAKHVAPIVLLIGYPSVGLVRRAQEVGTLAYLVLPAEARTLGAAIEIARTRFRELQIVREEAGDLQEALRTRLIVQRAKVTLMRRLELEEVDPFWYLHRQSRRTGTPLEEVAESLLTDEKLLFGKLDLVRSVDTILRMLVPRRVSGPQRVA